MRLTRWKRFTQVTMLGQVEQVGREDLGRREVALEDPVVAADELGVVRGTLAGEVDLVPRRERAHPRPAALEGADLALVLRGGRLDAPPALAARAGEGDERLHACGAGALQPGVEVRGQPRVAGDVQLTERRAYFTPRPRNQRRRARASRRRGARARAAPVVRTPQGGVPRGGSIYSTLSNILDNGSRSRFAPPLTACPAQAIFTLPSKGRRARGS